MKNLSTIALIFLLTGCGGGVSDDPKEPVIDIPKAPVATSSDNIYQFDVTMGGSLEWDDLCLEVPVELAPSASASVEIESIQLCRSDQTSDYFYTYMEVTKKTGTGSGCFAKLEGINFIDSEGLQLHSESLIYVMGPIGSALSGSIYTNTCMQESTYSLATGIFDIVNAVDGLSAAEFQEQLGKVQITSFSIDHEMDLITEKTMPFDVSSSDSDTVDFKMTNTHDVALTMYSNVIYLDDQGRFLNFNWGTIPGDSLSSLSTVSAGDTETFSATNMLLPTKVNSIMLIPAIFPGTTTLSAVRNSNNLETEYLEYRAKQQALFYKSQQ